MTMLATRQATMRPRATEADSALIGPAWYLIRSVGRTDRQVLDWLKLREIETYYPLVRELRPVPQRKLSQAQRRAGIEIMRPHMVPLFPKYYFVRLSLDDDSWHEVFRLGGLTGLVCRNNLPAFIDEALIAHLRGCEVDGAVPGKMPARLVFRAGERVRVTDGLFAAHDAVVEKGLDVAVQDIGGEERITVIVKLFGRHVPLQLGLHQFQAL